MRARGERWVRMNLGNVEALKLGPTVSVSDLHFEWKKDVWVRGVIRDFESQCDYVGGPNASHMPNRDVLWRAAGTSKEHGGEEKQCQHNRTGDDGLRFHSGSIAGSAKKFQHPRTPPPAPVLPCFYREKRLIIRLAKNQQSRAGFRARRIGSAQ